MKATAVVTSVYSEGRVFVDTNELRKRFHNYTFDLETAAGAGRENRDHCVVHRATFYCPLPAHSPETTVKKPPTGPARSEPGAIGRPQGRTGSIPVSAPSGPGFHEARYHLALAYEQAGRTDDAMEAYQEALRLHPEFTQARYMLAACCSKRGDFMGEIRLLADVLAREPGLRRRIQLWIALRNREQSREAVEQFRLRRG